MPAHTHKRKEKLEHREQIPKDIGNDYNVYDTAVGGSSTKGWDVKYEFLPHENKIVKRLNRTRLAVVAEGEEEALYDRPSHEQNIIDGNLNVDSNESDNEEE
eukprot:14355007-Ditylum_brightwellii.AAC.1